MDLMQAVKKSLDENDRFSNPILIFYKTMLGSGKTSASIALSQFIKEIKKVNPDNYKTQLLYSCVVSSARLHVGNYAYRSGQKFGLAAMQTVSSDSSYIYPRIINSFAWKN